MKENFVVLFKRDIVIKLDLPANGNDSPRDRGDLSRVRESDPTFCFAFGFILENQNASSDRFNIVKIGSFFRHANSIGYEPESTSTFALASAINFVILLGFP